MTKRDDAVELDGLGRDELVELVRRLVEQVMALKAENVELRRRLGLDSTNSGMPPSTDTEAARGKRARKRVDKNRASGRRRGKQHGAPGATLMQVTDPDETVMHVPALCGGCGDSLSDAAVVKRKTGQVFDLPEITVHITEHVVEARRCDCGYVTCADMPTEVRSWACWGPRVRAVCVYLVVAQHVPYDRAAESSIFDETGARVHNGDDAQRNSPNLLGGFQRATPGRVRRASSPLANRGGFPISRIAPPLSPAEKPRSTSHVRSSIRETAVDYQCRRHELIRLTNISGVATRAVVT